MTSHRQRQPPRPRRPDDDRYWSVDDALRVYIRLIRWYRTSDGVRDTYLAYHTHYDGKWPGSLSDEPARWALAAAAAAGTAEAMVHVDPIWCDPAMTNLLAAAADTYPAESILEHHFPAPDGIIIFAKPLPVVWLDPRSGASTDQRISALTWGRGSSTDGQPTMGITTWTRCSGLARFDGPRVTVYYPDMRSLSYANGLFGAEPTDHGGPAGPHRLLQAFTALCHTPLIQDIASLGSKAARRESRSAGLAERQVRRVYLRRPEHGDHELDAARAARAGHPPRGHWVRGHWKQQWHPTLAEHRTTWITGYPRGDFTRGIVPGTKILIGTDRPYQTNSDTHHR